ncbi:cytochrome P450 [Yinghuangia sp. ASG 101]|uniref:cytochrome P450 n=1 Tax=Yinghuangia sp. ASG 101 TaxID=2896848 RepID=UPI001E3804D2|nr:cytochrome P450 [Yinghuangia sp. ASG 101]UGQ10811.1 cytochrome P450 [Yinghuangia sp. ASG 101]
MPADFARCPARPEATRWSPDLGMWLIGRYDEIREVMTDRAGFGPDNALLAVTPPARPALRELAAARFALPPTLASNGGPTHRTFRAWTARWFSGSRVDAARPRAEALARTGAEQARARLDADGECDLVPPLCRPVAATVLLDLLGVEEGAGAGATGGAGADGPGGGPGGPPGPGGAAPLELDLLHRWSADSLELFWGRPDPERQHELAVSCAQFHRWLRDRVRAARESGGDGFLAGLTRLVLPEPDAREVTDEEAVSVCYFLLIAGQATTAQLAAATLHLLLGDRPVWERLCAEPHLAPRAVEEALRLVPSVTTWRRVAREERVVGGRHIRAGDQVLLRLADAGRDPDVFDEPERVRLDRPHPRAHLAFGVGPHRCLGAELARMEVTAVVDAAVRLLPGIRLAADDVPMLDLLSFRAPREVRVRRG